MQGVVRRCVVLTVMVVTGCSSSVDTRTEADLLYCLGFCAWLGAETDHDSESQSEDGLDKVLERGTDDSSGSGLDNSTDGDD